jgi:hypothetical protein
MRISLVVVVPAVLIAVLLVSFVPVVASAKFASIGDLPYVIESDSTDITVEASGKSTLIRDVMVRIVNDQGRESQSVQTLSFNSRAQTFKIIEAATLNGPPGKFIRSLVPKKDIEVKEVGEMSQSFDSIKQAGLSFPKVTIGSRIHLKYEMKNVEVPIKGFYSAGMSISGDNIEKFRLRVHSKLPLYYNVRDELKRLAHSLTPTKNGWFELDVHSTSPITTVITQEENSFVRPERVPAISISTLPDWKQYGRDLIPVHEALLAKPLPPVLEEIKKKAALQKNPIDQIQSVAASMAQEFRYFGDWRRIHGGYVPRSLIEISDSRYGDCKDLALSVTAIFRALGYKSNMAWIFRGDIAPPPAAYELPVDSDFNHAISRVEIEGKAYWVDATNPVAYARGVATDIADRPAFVIYPDGGKLDRTPPMKPEDSRFESHLAYEFQDDGSLVASGQIKLGGKQAIGLTARAFYSPVESVNYDLIHSLANNGKVIDSSVGDFERGSRIVQDLTIPVKFKLAESGLRTSAGLGYPLFRDDSVGRLLVETKDRVSDLYIETPNTSKTTIDLLNVKLVGKTSLDCDLHSDFIDLKRSVMPIKNGVSITDTVGVKKTIVTNTELQGSDFLKFQTAVRVCFNRAAVILEKR